VRGNLLKMAVAVVICAIGHAGARCIFCTGACDVGIQSYRDLEGWQLAIEMVTTCYELTASYPPEERYALTRESRRSAVSVPSNIAEGHNRRTRKAYLNHVNIALGSIAELETQIEIARRLRYVGATRTDSLRHQLERLGQMLRRLQQRLEAEQRNNVLVAIVGLLGTALLIW
jgi:four helix bundle protein